MTIRIAQLAHDLSVWAGARQQQLSDSVHARDEALARACGWEIAVGTGRFGFGDRVYRDPRFGSTGRSATARPGSWSVGGVAQTAVAASHRTKGGGSR
jgi:hypothetical protein